MQTILFTPAELTDDFEQKLESILSAHPIAAVILRRQHNEIDVLYAKRVMHLVKPIQKFETAVLLDGMPDLVQRHKTDGVHLQAGQKQFQDAIENLQPDFIVGAGDVRSDHEALLRGEVGADYVLFGDPDRAPSPEEIYMASWWAETVQVDGAICADPTALDEAVETGAEFFACGELFWQVDEPLKVLTDLAEKHAKFMAEKLAELEA